ncbi:MAG: glycosyltransferase family 39 protein [Candidatus Rokubacteria bacterium]|nr:glycosyltransferase family 39 protein [Candidatus Rokubacteria bacterium]
MLAFAGLGAAPFIDPPEGFHAEIAREMGGAGGWITPRLNSVRYFDKPPVPYWLMAVSFGVAGPTPAAARLWGALAAIGVAVATALIGVRLRGPRLGVLAGVMVTANLGVFLYARIVKPDLLFVLFITLAWTGVVLAWPGSRAWLALFYAALGLAAITKDILGAIGPLAVLALALAWTGERPIRRWFPWWGLAILLVVALPWYLAVEIENPGFLWYTVVDNHILNVARQRAFPDEDVPLGALEFLVVTIAAFLPWTLAAVPGAVAALRDRATGPAARLWRLFALWGLGVLVVFTLSPFKLPHYGLPAFPALALLAARAWDDALATPARARGVILPALVVFALVAAAFLVTGTGLVSVGDEPLSSVDVATRNLAARGQAAPVASLEAWRPVLITAAVLFTLGTAALAAAAWRVTPRVAAGAATGAMVLFLPVVAGVGMAEFARVRSARPVTETLLRRAGPADVVVHEGALENSGSLLLALGRPVRVVNGLHSNLAYGATFPDSRDLFWDDARLAREWEAAGPRRFLVSVVAPERSVVRRLPPGRVHLLARTGTHWLYSNLADGEVPRR